MYKIIKYNRRFNSKSFSTYEEARRYIRKWIRNNLGLTGNPPIKWFGFSVQKV